MVSKCQELDLLDVNKSNQNAKAKTAHGTVIHAAAKNGHIRVVEFLQECGLDRRLEEQAGPESLPTK